MGVSFFGKKSLIIHFWLIFLSMALVFPVNGIAASAVVNQSVSFGTIDLYPAGDTITIAAAAGPAVPVAASNSVVTGGNSGLITVTSGSVEHVDIIYPVSVTMASGPNHIQLVSIDINSQYRVGGADTLGGGIPLIISVGGVITLVPGQANGSYTALIPIILNYS